MDARPGGATVSGGVNQLSTAHAPTAASPPVRAACSISMPRSQPSRSSTSASPPTSTSAVGDVQHRSEAPHLRVGLFTDLERNHARSRTHRSPASIPRAPRLPDRMDGSPLRLLRRRHRVHQPNHDRGPMRRKPATSSRAIPVTVDSMKLTTSPHSGTYTSPVFDGGSGFITSITLNRSATHRRHAITYETRTGTTQRPTPRGRPGARRRGRDGRQPEPAYLQYRRS